MFHISLNGIKSVQATVGLFLIGGMAVGLTMGICMTLLLYEKVPFNVYIAAPISAVIVILILNITVPQVIVVRLVYIWPPGYHSKTTVNLTSKLYIKHIGGKSIFLICDNFGKLQANT